MFFIQIQIDLTAATRQISAMYPYTATRDVDFVIKTVLTEALSGSVVRPWDIAGQNGRILSIVGYSKLSPAEIERRLASAPPGTREAVLRVMGYEIPKIEEGERLAFSIRLCPTIRCRDAEGRKRERDVFLHAVENGQDGASREQVYAEYFAERLSGAEIDDTKLTRFQLAKRCRKAGPKYASLIQPDVVLAGTLTVTDPSALRQTLLTGIGRQRAFGSGMMRLKSLRVRTDTISTSRLAS